MPTVLAIPTSVGEARATVHPASGDRKAVLVLGHGAGGGIGAADLVALAQRLPSQGITVVRVEQPWRVAVYQLDHTSVPRPLTPCYLEYYTIMHVAMRDINQGANVKRTLDQAAGQIDSACAKYRQ